MRRQRPNGEWLQEGIEGATNKSWFVPPFCHPLTLLMEINSTVSYPNYKFTFTIMALGMFSRIFGNEEMDL